MEKSRNGLKAKEKEVIQIALSAEMAKFKKDVAELKSYRGQGTELVSVYIPPNFNVNEIVTQLNGEVSQAANIKSSRTRKMVQGALQRILQALKSIDYKIPERGLVV